MTTTTNDTPKKRKGLAAMSLEQRRLIASMGGQASHAQGKRHSWTPQEAREASRKGVEAKRRKAKARH